jgi:hypothetical protein
MSKNYLISLHCLLLCLAIPLKSLSQINCSTCSGTGSPGGMYWCVTTAAQLYDALTGFPSNNPIQPFGTIEICGTIYLGDLGPSDFPLEVPAFVTLQGDYDFVEGTRIVFPFRYKSGLKCDKQLRVSGSEVIENETSPDPASPENLIMQASEHVFVFALQQGSQFNHICLQGPKPDIKEGYMNEFINFSSFAHCVVPAKLQPLEGLGGGIIMRGNNCQINFSEIYGFPTYNVHVRPEVTSTTSPVGVGTAIIHNSFLHNTKLNGYGYGIFGSGGGGGNCVNNTPCPLGTANDKEGNANQEPEVIEVTKTLFMENGKDADAAGHRYSFNVENSTMGLGVNNYIVNQHAYTKICNIAPISLPNANCPNLNPGGTPRFPDCCSDVITQAGGENISITNSYFFRGENEFNFIYPNTYAFTGSPICNSPFIPVNAGLTLIGNTFFGNNTDPVGRVKISDSDHHDWRFEHFNGFNPQGPLNTLNAQYVNNKWLFYEQNFFNLFTDLVPGVPVVNIGANVLPVASSAYVTPNSIYKGDKILFDTERCLDALHNPSASGNMFYMFRYHEMADDLADEIRTDHVPLTTPLEHTFTNIGITNVNVVGVDRATNVASYFAIHPLTVKPLDRDYHLVFNIKDTYDGPWLHNNSGGATCNYDVSDMVLPPGTLSPTGINTCPGGICRGDVILPSTTGFQKFVKINGYIIWSEDIGADAGGWERIEYPDPNITTQVPLATCLCSDDGIVNTLLVPNCPNGINTPDVIEIGIMAVSPVDATIVRGVNLYIDDVYINAGKSPLGSPFIADNQNVLINGDFEDFNPANLWPVGWNAPVQNNPPFTTVCSPTLTVSQNTPKLSTEEVRSGIYSYWARIKPALDGNANLPFQAVYSPIYAHGGVAPYFSISQGFNFQNPPPPRLANPVEPLIDFTLVPNPSAFGTILHGAIQNLPTNQSYQISVYSPDGTLAYLSQGSTPQITLTKAFPAGVYYVKIWGKDFSNYKRIVIVG